ncbi:(Fe-S)-binding protein [Paenibacillus thiaminolyticus]|uniref:(Fe-S)-binding protein n=3 Tax=Paenibacillus thiaminolyticus TaxID=49283 RepID=A0ABT4FZB3_PANTH|nr:(Fe-S)-binding protein [Paenibacillus thiaminolyticus]MCY9536864.1 (Fe-S)-binding protein [Paenibacillus thiaminolyticus]MCY9604514.1 (Fe-S)-binding protein [Paenibacillus thiaminolyticus]MCY9608433.1 (Fe-S)-binding protein [Paenibacillus thiaminolyticus]MCY9613971.1 (Fe-S)-binding protein [Paenibacillus thiaminolyticus]MCY9621919.1 (Fe-S)-binding protein [Paenibacillus thiaminolyticus]
MSTGSMTNSENNKVNNSMQNSMHSSMNGSMNGIRDKESGKGTAGALQQQLVQALDYEQLMNCMRCGFCQPSCPTFRETGLEAASPRGRIALMKAVADGLMEPDAAFKQQMDLCLGCRACEPVCPSDVKYGQLLEQTREVLFEHTDPQPGAVPLRRLHKLAKPVFKRHNRLRLMSTILQAYQRSGLQRLARRGRMLRWLPQHMQTMERIMPRVDSRGVVKRTGGRRFPAKGERIGTVGLFRGCIMDVLFTETNVKTVRLLTESGYDVVIPEEQSCCGALFSHSGNRRTALEFAMQNVKAFREAGVDYIAINAGGCGATLIEYDHLLADEAEWAEPARQFSKQVKDISELLLRSGRWNDLAVPAKRSPAADSSSSITVTYQDSCHLRNVMRAGDSPRRLLCMIPDTKFVELEGAEICCGSAGIYNLVQPQMANDILDARMDAVDQTQASVILTSNPGCLLQMKAGVEREQAHDRIQVMHIIDYFAEKVLK